MIVILSGQKIKEYLKLVFISDWYSKKAAGWLKLLLLKAHVWGNPIRNMKNQTFLRFCEYWCLELYFSNSHVSDQTSDPKMAKFDPKMGQTGSIFN